MNYDASLIDKYSAFAVDLDGVVWRGSQIIDGAIAGLNAILDSGKPLLLLTNNGAYRPEAVSKRLSEAGAAVAAGQVLTSTVVARQWIMENGLEGEPAFILGPAEIVAQMDETVKVVGVEIGAAARVVLVGRYTDLSYERLAVAADSLRNGAVFLALNNDPVMPVEGGGMIPGTGSIVAALEAASGHEAVVLGKPRAPMMDAAAALLGKDGVLMIGDRPEADIAGARRNGWDAVLVASGLTDLNAVVDPEPDYRIPGLGSLADSHDPRPEKTA